MVCTLIFAIFRVHFRGNFLINHALGLRYFPHFIFLIRNKVYPILHEFCTDFARQLAHANPQESHRNAIFRYVPVPWVSLWVKRGKLWYGHFRTRIMVILQAGQSPIYNVRVIVQAGQGSIQNMVLVILLLLFTYYIWIDIYWIIPDFFNGRRVIFL